MGGIFDQRRRDVATINFLEDSRREQDRLASMQQHATADIDHKDMNGNMIMIGDIVAIDDEEHKYDKWICMVDAVGSRSLVKIYLGIPPTNTGATKEQYEERRKERPRDRVVTARTSSVRLDGVVTPIEE